MTTLFCFSHPISHPSAFTSLRGPPFSNSPPLRIPAGGRRRRGSAVAARAGPTSSSILFAIALPSSLLAVTIFAALRMGDKLDREWLEEMEKSEALKEVDDDEDDENDNGGSKEDSMETYVQEEPALPNARNRPKREV